MYADTVTIYVNALSVPSSITQQAVVINFVKAEEKKCCDSNFVRAASSSLVFFFLK